MYNTISALFTGICNAIRSRDGTTEKINHQDIPARILSIQGSGGLIQEFEDDVGEIGFSFVDQEDIAEEEIIWIQES